LDPLSEDGYVSISSVGRRKEVTLTDRGSKALRAFRHKLESIGAEEG
jgi:DNA-binding PadR family transcriptional regulator